MVLYGGLSATGALSTTWALTGTTWTKLTTASPAARTIATMAFDTASGQMILVGGASGRTVCRSFAVNARHRALAIPEGAGHGQGRVITDKLLWCEPVPGARDELSARLTQHLRHRFGERTERSEHRERPGGAKSPDQDPATNNAPAGDGVQRRRGQQPGRLAPKRRRYDPEEDPPTQGLSPSVLL